MDQNRADKEGHDAGLYGQLPHPDALHSLHIPGDCLQSLRHLVSGVLQGLHSNALKAASGVRLPAAQALLSTDLVHGLTGGHLHCNHSDGHCCFVREKQELQVQT